MQFRVTVSSTDGSQAVRTIEAETRFAVYDIVRNDGGTVVSIEEAEKFSISKVLHAGITFGSGVKQLELIRLARNLSTMLVAGLSISRALSVIERQSGNVRLKAVMVGIEEAIKKGSSFHEALGLYPKVFPGIFIAMAQAGEESGSLSDSLNVVGLQMSRAEELTRKVKGAMIYPSIVVSAIIVVTILMLMFVVPTLTSTFKSLNVAIPLATQVIVALSDFLVHDILFVLPALALLVFGGITFAKSTMGGRTILWVSLRLPVIGSIVKETYSARTARTLSSLLNAGVPVLDALEITKGVVHAESYARVVGDAQEYVKKGGGLSKSFGEHPELYPILMSDMLAVGEETGKVAEMLRQIAEFYEESVSESTKDLSSIIEPVLMLLIGVFVGIFAVAMIAPIYSLSSAF